MDFNDPVTIVMAIILSIAIAIGIFAVLRELVLWYYKIDKRLQAAERTNLLLEKLMDHFKVDYEKSSDNTITVKIKESGKVITVGLNAWEKMKEEYGEESYVVINK